MGILTFRIAAAYVLMFALSGATSAMAWVPPQTPAAPLSAHPPAATMPDPAWVPPFDSPATPGAAASLMQAGDAAVDAGSLDLAAGLYNRLVREYPDSPEAGQARRALKIIAVHERAMSGASPRRPVTATPASEPGVAASNGVAGDASRPGDRVIIRHEPYSTRTSERLRLTSWEKLDFGVTSFLYGMSVGFSFALSSNPSDVGAASLPIALGATLYTLGAVGYLKLANPDRGDLPLALAITSYVPTTVLLVSNFAFDNPNQNKIALEVAGAGLLSVPIAIAVTQKLDLDPGDMQLVRDAGFWGLAMGALGTLGFGGTTNSDFGYNYYQTPSGQKVAGFSLLGLYGGLGLGVLAAANSELSLERVRVTTWGGYGGAILGAIVGLGATNGSNSSSASETGVYRGLTIGALLGLIVTFASSSGLDGIPPDDGSVARAPGPRWAPTFLTATGAGGKLLPTFGFAGAMP